MIAERLPTHCLPALMNERGKHALLLYPNNWKTPTLSVSPGPLRSGRKWVLSRC